MIQVFTGRPRKNDALMCYGATQPLPWVYAYVQQSIEVVYGPACKKEHEIFLDNCQKDRVPVIERRGGGGSVVLLPGMVVILVVGKPASRPWAESVFGLIHDGLIKVLGSRCPKQIEKKGVSDLTIENRKILGSSLYLPGKSFLYFYQSSLIVDSDIRLFSRYLNHPWREPDYRKGRSHEEFCTSLRQQGYALGASETCLIIQQELASTIS